MQMKILLIYFTGTFNTEYVVSKIEKNFSLDGHLVTKLEVNCQTILPSLDEFDLIGIGYPIHAFNAPKAIIHLIKKMPILPNKKYFIFKTSGETLSYNNASSRKIIKIMKRRRFVLVGEYHFAMPYNIIFKFDDEFVKEQLFYVSKLSVALVKNIENNEIVKIKSNVYYNFVANILLIQHFGAWLNSFFYKIDKSKCNQCQKCLKSCPTQNIYLKNGQIKFHHDCSMCMRCSFYCPNNAIKIGFLNHWKVNGDYNLSTLEKDASKNGYAERNKKKFYRCFKKYFDQIH